MDAPAVLSLVWSTIRWPLLALLLGFTALECWALPILFAARGFLLAFSIASFVRLFGSTGCLLAFLVFGITGAVAIPALFVLGVQSLLAARVLASRFLGGGETSVSLRKGLFSALRRVCRGAVCVCVRSSWCVPALISGMAGLLAAA